MEGIVMGRLRSVLNKLAGTLKSIHSRKRKIARRIDSGVSVLESLEPRQLLAADFQLLKDINSTPYHTNLGQFRTIGDVAYFHNDTQLWKTDGTDAGTVLIKTIRSGQGHASFSQLTDLSGTLLFVANDGTSGPELWKSDGTEAGTVLVKDINPGAASSEPGYLTVAGGTLYFRANDGTHGPELWKSDGTSGGTMMVRETATGTFSENWPTPQHGAPLGSLGSTLFFRVRDAAGNFDLWKTDGTQQNTTLVRDFSQVGGWNATKMVPLGNKLVFSAADSELNQELWITDGSTAGTQLLKDVRSGGSGSEPWYLTPGNGVIYFAASSSGNFRSLWKTDGTSAGTVQVKDILGNFDGSLTDLTVIDQTLYFRAYRSASGTELWKSDGTSVGTTVVPAPDPALPLRQIDYLTPVSGILFFSAFREDIGIDWWTLDPVTSAITLVRDLIPGYSSFSVFPLEQLQGQLLFSGGDATTGRELWTTDGTGPGTQLVHDFHLGSETAKSSHPSDLTEANGKLFFFATDDSRGLQLWMSSGESQNTVPVTDRGKPLHVTGRSIKVDERLYFFANQEGNDFLWSTDGTESGTHRVSDIPFPDTYRLSWSNVSGILYFVADDGTNGWQIWRSDGTQAGTWIVSQNIWSANSSPSDLTNVAGKLYFSASGESGRELWKTDGTVQGTTLVRDILPGPFGSNPGNLINVNGTLYFSASTPETGVELWKSDGTESGTMLVKDILTGTAGSNPVPAGQMNGLLFFRHDWGPLWRSDGTPDGTYSLNVSVDFLNPGDGVFLNGRIYFPARSPLGSSKAQLWQTDGTVAGTQLVREIETGVVGATIRYLTEVNGLLYFSVWDETAGSSLWQSDGTGTGTALFFDFAEGASSGYPQRLTGAANHLFVSAEDSQHGRELFVAEDPNRRPTLLTLSSATVAENAAASTIVGSFSTVDPDALDSHAYRLVEGTGSEDNGRFTIAGNTLRTTVPLDFEAKSSYSLRVRTTDSGGKWMERIFAVSVTNVNEPPTAIQLPQNFGTLADFVRTSVAVKLADITVVDDELGTNTLSLTGPDAGYFSLKGRELFLRAGISLNRVAKPTYNFTINVDDTSVGTAKDATLATQLQVTDSSTRITGPEAVTGLQRPAIAWTAVGGAAKYYVWIRNSSTNVNDFIIRTVSQNSFTPSSDLGIGKYVVWVRPVGPSEEKAGWSSPYSFQVVTPVTLVTPRLQQITTRPLLQWNEVAGAVRYDLWVDNLTTRQNQVVRISTLRGRSWLPTSDLPMGSYRFWVRGIDAGGNTGQWSPSADFMILPVVSQISPTSSTFDLTPEFRWNPVPGAAGYRLIVRNANTNAVLLQQTVSEPTFSPSNNLPIGRYLWSVYAVSGTGVPSPAATTAEFFAGGRPAIQMTADNITVQRFQWTPVEGAASYSLYLRQLGSTAPAFELSGLTGTTWSPTQRFPAGTYRLWIRAVSASGTLSPWSNSVDLVFGA